MSKRFFDFMACTPQTDPCHVRDATTDHCIVCRQAVWISPSGYAVSLCTPVLCIPCAFEKARNDGKGLAFASPSDAQIEELRAHGVDATRKELERELMRYAERALRRN